MNSFFDYTMGQHFEAWSLMGPECMVVIYYFLNTELSYFLPCV